MCWKLCYSKIRLTSDRTGDIIKNPPWTLSLATRQHWKQYGDQSEYASVLTQGRVFLGEACTEKKKISFHLDNILSIWPGYFNTVILFKNRKAHITAFACTCKSCSFACRGPKCYAINMLDSLRGLSINHYINNLMCFLSSKCTLRQVREALLTQKENYSLPVLKVA